MLLPQGLELRLDVGKRHGVHPGVALPGVVAVATIELLEETEHPGAAEALFEGNEAFTADFFGGFKDWHVRQAM